MTHDSPPPPPDSFSFSSLILSSSRAILAALSAFILSVSLISVATATLNRGKLCQNMQTNNFIQCMKIARK